ncbi:MAG TPA: hypothetical protein VF855_12165, partial [Acidimicrobiales bacterium]
MARWRLLGGSSLAVCLLVGTVVVSGLVPGTPASAQVEPGSTTTIDPGSTTTTTADPGSTTTTTDPGSTTTTTADPGSTTTTTAPTTTTSEPPPTTTTTVPPPPVTPPPGPIVFEATSPSRAVGYYVTVSGTVAPNLRGQWVRLQRFAGKWTTLTGALPVGDGSFVMRAKRWGPGPWRLVSGTTIVQFGDDRIVVATPPSPTPAPAP